MCAVLLLIAVMLILSEYDRGERRRQGGIKPKHIKPASPPRRPTNKPAPGPKEEAGRFHDKRR